jgi:hypothetical protein
MKYGKLRAGERAVLDAYEAVQLLFWSHPVVEAYDEAVSASLSRRPPFTRRAVSRSPVGRQYAKLEPLVHRAKEIAASALPHHRLARAALWQCYPTCEINRRLTTDEALAMLAKIADVLA